MCIVHLNKNIWKRVQLKADMLDGGGVVLPFQTSVAMLSCLRKSMAIKDDKLSDN